MYVGITSKSVKIRWVGKATAYKNNPIFCSAINKYGWDNIEHKILYTNLSKESAVAIELDLIYYYKKCKLCYNITDGGEGYTGLVHTKEWRENLSKRNKNNTYNLGKVLSEETKRKIGKANSKTVLQIDPISNSIIEEFESTHEVQRKLGISYKLISRACNKNYKSHGYLWKFKCNLH